MENRKLRVAITHGDTNGIGYEIIFKTFSEPAMLELCTPIIYGSPKVAAYHRNALGIQGNFTIINSAAEAHNNKVNLLTTFDQEIKVDLGNPSKEAGMALLAALEKAMADYKEGLFDVLVTAPINKNNIQSDDFHFCGHTEYIEERAGNGDKALMILLNDMLRVALVTTHLPIRDVAAAITKESIIEKATIFHNSLKRDFRISNPRIAVLALNPHAGDGGLLGREEQEIIRPAVVEAFNQGVLAFGPFAADGLFAGGGYAKYDGILAMYHDQGLAPFKTLSPDGVNFTAGLSKVRTSPDHGTAFDIAGKDKADPQSMRNAIYAAIDIAEHRRAWAEWTRNPLQRAERDRGGRDVSVKDLPQTEKED